MSKNAGNLLWNRRRITVSVTVDIDTGLTQVGRSFGNSSQSEPPFGVNGTVSPPDGTLPASRVQVIPMAPLSKWATITHGEPYFNTTTGTVHVQFATGEGPVTNLNVLFWDPHTVAGPGAAVTYNP